MKIQLLFVEVSLLTTKSLQNVKCWNWIEMKLEHGNNFLQWQSNEVAVQLLLSKTSQCFIYNFRTDDFAKSQSTACIRLFSHLKWVKKIFWVETLISWYINWSEMKYLCSEQFSEQLKKKVELNTFQCNCFKNPFQIRSQAQGAHYIKFGEVHSIVYCSIRLAIYYFKFWKPRLKCSWGNYLNFGEFYARIVVNFLL